MNVIEFKKLNKSYGKARGIVDVTFSVKEGEIFGFIGPNGSGKSTTIRTMLNLIHKNSGEVTVFGKNPEEYYYKIANDIGYLPSEVFYYDNMRVIDLLNYSASFYKKDCSEKIKYLCNELDLNVNKKIEDLSFGNRKKVGIVQGLLHEPKLIILDEPTSGLDPLMQQKFFNLIKEENKKGATVLFSSHILSEIQNICDRVAIIKEGKIVKVDNVKSLMKDNYTKIKVEFNKKQDKNFFDIEGVTNLINKNKSVTFLFKGDINKIISKLSNVKLNDILIEEPTLEEIFIHYYN